MKNALAELREKQPHFFREKKALPEIHFKDLFGNDHPVEIEIGCGKGKFLIERAGLEPDMNFLGVDIAGKWMRKGVARKEKKKLSNLEFMKAEMRYFLERLRPASVSVFHIYFPDPWPKKRHHKRRIVTADFLKALCVLLIPGGSIELATDHEEYYLVMKEAIEQSGACWSAVQETVNQRIVYPRIKTNYELKFEKEGRDLHYFQLTLGKEEG